MLENILATIVCLALAYVLIGIGTTCFVSTMIEYRDSRKEAQNIGVNEAGDTTVDGTDGKGRIQP